MEGGSLLHLESKGNVKAEMNQKLSLMENKVKVRRGLADITNMMNQVQKPAKPSMMDHKIPNPVTPSSDKDCIAHLLKENTALLRLLGERNKIIEINDLELRNLRVSVQQLQLPVQQLQQQNWQLARANSQMLEDLNLGKDRLRVAQHQLGCTVAALNTIKLELEQEKKKLKKEPCIDETTSKEQASITCEGVAVEAPLQDEKKNLKKEPCVDEITGKERASITCEGVAVEAPLQDEKKACIPPSRKRAIRSLVSASVTNEGGGSKDDSRKKSPRRGSSNLKSRTCEPKEDLFEAPPQDEKKACIPPSRKRATRSLVSASVTNEGVGSKDDNRSNLKSQTCEPKEDLFEIEDDNRRKSSRRGSSNSKSQTCEPKEDLFEIEDVKFPVRLLLTDHITGSRTVRQGLSVSSSDSCSMAEVKKEEDMEAGGSLAYQTKDSHHSSVGRPSRRATMGVSYKEPLLNTKMRR